MHQSQRGTDNYVIVPRSAINCFSLSDYRFEIEFTTKQTEQKKRVAAEAAILGAGIRLKYTEGTPEDLPNGVISLGGAFQTYNLEVLAVLISNPTVTQSIYSELVNVL